MAVSGRGISLWLVASRGDQPVAVSLLTKSSIMQGLLLSLPAGRLLEAVARRMVPRAEMQAVPACSSTELGADEIADVIGLCGKHAHSLGAVDLSGSLAVSIPYTMQLEIGTRLQAAGYRTGKWATYRVPLSNDPDRMLAAIRQKARSKVRKAVRAGLTSRKLGRAPAGDYLAKWAESRKRNGLWSLRLSPDVWQLIAEVAPGVYHHFAVMAPDGDILAGGSAYCYGTVATSMATFISDRAFRDKLPAQDLLRWHILCWAAEQGYEWYDLAGVDPNPRPGSKAERIRSFKAKWGGDYIEYVTFRKTFGGIRSYLLEGITRRRKRRDGGG